MLEVLAQGERTESGSTPSVWLAKGTAWASIEPLEGQMLFEAEQARSETTVRIRMRWHHEVAESTGKTLRIRHDDRVYRIQGRPINIGERGREIEVLCHEWV